MVFMKDNITTYCDYYMTSGKGLGRLPGDLPSLIHKVTIYSLLFMSIPFYISMIYWLYFIIFESNFDILILKIFSLISYRKVFNSAFFTLCINLGFIDMFNAFNTLFIWVFMEFFAPCWRFVNEPNAWVWGF